MQAASANFVGWIKIWAAALTRPTQAAYAALFGTCEPQRRLALVWLMLAGVIAAVLNMLTYRAPAEILLAVMACAMPVFAFAYLALTVVTARSALWIAAQFGASGSLDRLLYALAAINAPMSILSALAYLLPYGNFLSYALSVYWAYLTVLAVKTLTGLSWGQAITASLTFILISLLMIGLTISMAALPPIR
jgi:hypothetical protein